MPKAAFDRHQNLLQCPQGGACSHMGELEKLRSELETLRTLVHTDALTGLFNYRHFTQALDLEMERARRSGKSVALLMMDLDHFKSFNDTWGHEFGNKTLVHVARLIQTTVRRLDIPCRYGGEEFAVILPDTTLHAAITLAERLRAIIAETPLYSDDTEVHVTCSAGVDVHVAGDRDDVESFVRRTDAWLLQAKASGRNRVCHPAERPATHVSTDERDLLLG
jgi:diguanylate cyclase (GGDEF)-like protein